MISLAIFVGLVLFVIFRVLLKFGYLYANEETSFWHHYYTGLILLMAGIALLPVSVIAGIILIGLGLWCIVDDFVQHRKQVFDKNFHSFLHYVGVPLYKARQYLVKKYGWTWLNKF